MGCWAVYLCCSQPQQKFILKQILFVVIAIKVDPAPSNDLTNLMELL